MFACLPIRLGQERCSEVKTSFAPQLQRVRLVGRRLCAIAPLAPGTASVQTARHPPQINTFSNIVVVVVVVVVFVIIIVIVAVR